MKVFTFKLDLHTPIKELTLQEGNDSPIRLGGPAKPRASFEIQAAGTTVFEARVIEHGPHRELFTVDYAESGTEIGEEMVKLSEVLEWLANEHGTAAVPRFQRRLER